MSEVNLFPYYPKYIYLDGTIQKTGINKLRLFVDLKGCARTIYTEYAAKSITNITKMSRHIDVTLFTNILGFIEFHKNYAKKRGVDLEIHFFLEQGESAYHTKIDKNYKSNRKTACVFGLDEATSELYWKVLNKNYDLLGNVCNKIPKVSFIRLRWLEADFLPYYLMNHFFKDTESWTNIIYSPDKDMVQCLNNRNQLQFIKGNNINNCVLDCKSAIERFLRVPSTYDTMEFPIILALIGDPVDGVPGLKGIGPKTIVKYEKEIKEILGPVELVFGNIKAGKTIFNKDIRTNNKCIQTILANEQRIIDNIRLTSYDFITDYFMDDSHADIIKLRRNTDSLASFEPARIRNGQVLVDALDKVGISLSLSEGTLYNLFE